MNRIKLIHKNNKKIILCDLKGINRDEILNVCRDIVNLFDSEITTDEKANFLIDITGVEIPPKLMEELTSLLESYRGSIKKEGVIGLVGFRKFLFNAYGWIIGAHLKAFENRDVAMNWLAS